MMGKQISILCAVILALGVCDKARAAEPLPADVLRAEKFEGMRAKAQDEIHTLSEKTLMRILDEGAALGKPYTTSLLLNDYLSARPRPSRTLLRKAIDNALSVGDFPRVVSRCKTYLASAKPNPESAEVAAILYTALIEFLDADEEAYRFMKEDGGRYRLIPDVRKYDPWYLKQAVAAGDFPAAAGRLALVFQDALPLEQERLYYGESLDWLLEEARRPVPSKYEAAADCTALAGRIRGDEERKARLTFYAANLTFKSGVDGKSDEQLDQEFAPVVLAAGAYLRGENTAQTLQDILEVFSDGDWKRGWGENQAEAKQAFFVAAFDRLPEAERAQFLDGNRYLSYLATPEQWMMLGVKHQDLIKRSRGASAIPVVTSSDDPAVFKAQAQYLQNVQSVYAIMVNSLGASDEFSGVLQHFAVNESWKLDTYSNGERIVRDVWSIYKRWAKDGQEPPSEDSYISDVAMFGVEYIAKTPLAMDSNLVRLWLPYVWRSLGDGPDDKHQIVDTLALLDWVPYDPETRAAIMGGVYGEFTRWVDGIQKELEPAKKKLERATTDAESTRKLIEQNKDRLAKLESDTSYSTTYLLKQQEDREQKLIELTNTIHWAQAECAIMEQQLDALKPIEAAFNRAMNLSMADPDKAPNALCRNLSQAVLAAERKDSAAFMQAARALYPAVKQYDQSHTVMGRALLRYLISPAPAQDLDISDFQAEILADQLSRWDTGPSNDPIVEVADWILSSKPDWGWGNIPVADKNQALKFNRVLAAAVAARLGQENGEPLFDWTLRTRYGKGWKDTELNTDLFKKIVDGKHLPSVTIMMHLRAERFPSLVDTYPVATYFVDRFIEESSANEPLDGRYWSYKGTDPEKKIRNFAAERLGDYKTLPFGYGGTEPVYERRAYFGWQDTALQADAVSRNAMLDKLESYYGKTRFDTMAMGHGRFEGWATLEGPKERARFFDVLKQCLDRMDNAPSRVKAPRIYYVIRNITDETSLTNEELDLLIRYFPRAAMGAGTAADTHTARLIHRGLLRQGRSKELFALIPYFWRYVRTNPSQAGYFVEFSEALLADGENELAAVYSLIGLDQVSAGLPEEMKDRMAVVRSRSVVALGGALPVDSADPNYVIFAAQGEYMRGNVQRAWQMYAGKEEPTAGIVQELEPDFVNWLVDMHSQSGEFDAAENLARSLMTWIDADPTRFSRETQAQSIFAYANIAFRRLEYPRAKALYGKLAAAEEYAGTQARTDALFRVVEIDRLTGQYDQATERLGAMMTDPSRAIQTEGYYQLAHIKFDMEEPVEARKQLDRVFALNPSHSEARILEGKVNLMLKEYEKASELRYVGVSVDRDIVVPGKPMRISLLDENLSIVGKSSAIEIRVWTDSGDEEIVLLTPFADTKTRFEGELVTELGPIQKGDYALQLLGNDQVHYDFSDDFRKTHKVTAEVSHSLSVASDSSLYVSSGNLLSNQELELRLLEERIRGHMPDVETNGDLSTRRPPNQIKPGNFFNVRVVAPDRNVTHEKDTVVVKVATSSGDGIPAFTLTETGTHSGVFEGAIPTETAPATAFAKDSMEGREPNFAISSGKYPPWVALPDNARPKTFSIDLNSSVKWGVMTIAASVPERKLKDFLVQTSVNGREFKTLGSWPTAVTPWSGAPTITVLKSPEDNRVFTSENKPSLILAELEQIIENHSRAQVRTVEVKEFPVHWTPAIFGAANELDIARYDEYIVHFSAAFYMPNRGMRRFEVHAKDESHRIILALDGQVGREIDEQGRERNESPLVFDGLLTKGVHRLDVYVMGRADRKRGGDFEIHCNAEDDAVQPCPLALFDPAMHPEIEEAVYRAPATITANNDGTEFKVSFAGETEARIVRLFIHDFETDAPAIDRIGLETAQGEIILPTLSDLMTLRENNHLEIVPGDQISVVYTDPKPLEESGRIREAFLSATYANAEVNAVSEDMDRRKEITYIPLRRFKAGDTVSVLVRDFDLDESDQLDTARFTVRGADDMEVEMEALETAPHSGLFVGRIFPVSHAPQRRAEVRVTQEDPIVIRYMDRENTDPGIPWIRETVVEQAWYQEPKLRIWNVASKPFTPKRRSDEDESLLKPDRMLVVTSDRARDEHEAARVMIGGPVVGELVWPTIALSGQSTATVYLQTSSARAAARWTEGKPFDTNMAGTVIVTMKPTNRVRASAPEGYYRCNVVYDRDAGEALEDGRFMFSVPTTLVEPEPVLNELGEEVYILSELQVKPNDTLFVGFRYAAGSGPETNWIVREVALDAEAFFDVTDRRYESAVTERYIGERMYFRVIDMKKDLTDDRDSITVSVESDSGHARTIALTETLSHSGIFRGMVELAYTEPGIEVPEDPDLMPTTYGSIITSVYDPGEGRAPLSRVVTVHKGADGVIMPFTKRFKDPEMAVRTQLTVAEAYFELAKRHRALGETGAAEEEIAEGKRLMEEALRQNPETDLRVQADYLLANLVLELADETKDTAQAQEHYRNAIARFSDIVSTYKNSAYAAKAQFKKALALEKMGDIDQASEEYVKLSYRWPDNELVPETIARLGQYFFDRGKTLTEEAAAATVEMDKEVRWAKGREMFKTAAEVFSSLGARFPTHKLADKTTVLSAQCFIRAEEYDSAVKTFTSVIEKPDLSKELRAEAMYWCGDAYAKGGHAREAYLMYKKITWDYPESTWAKYARGKLAEKQMLGLERREFGQEE